MYFRISRTARILDVSTDWLRGAEASGKIPPARRDINGWRVYSETDIEVLQQLLAPRYLDTDQKD